MSSERNCADAVAIARRYLAFLQRRDLAAAEPLLHPDAVLVFPGGGQRKNIHEIAAGSGRRYRTVAKSIESCDACPLGSGRFAVYVRGTLHGEWLDGTGFSGIRFIDRFEIADGRILRQEVWNDSAEFRPT